MVELLRAWSKAEGIAQAKSLFTATFNTTPEGVWAAPGRVNLIGEHIDYCGGLCLPIALPHAAYSAIRARKDRRVRMIPSEGGDPLWEGTLDDIYPGADIPKWIAYAAGPVWALMQDPKLAAKIKGFEAAVASCVPLGAGLSSSAAIECSVAMAVDGIFRLGLGDNHAGRTIIAEAGIRAENEVAGAATGGLDQAASMHCTAAHALLLDCLHDSQELIPFDLDSRGLRLLVIDTMAHHSLDDGQYAQRRATCDAVAAREGVRTLRELPDPEGTLSRLTDPTENRRIRHVITEIERVRLAVKTLKAGDFEGLGELFYASHSSLREDYEVSAPELDVAVDVAKEAGALGARMTGGGFGGSAIAIIRQGNIEPVCAAITSAFAARGWTPPRFLDAYAAAGARQMQ